MSDDPFDPDDIAELEAAFARVEQEEQDISGYRMEFFLDDATANAIVNEFHEARLGNKRAMRSAWERYGYIVAQISDAITAFGTDD